MRLSSNTEYLNRLRGEDAIEFEEHTAMEIIQTDILGQPREDESGVFSGVFAHLNKVTERKKF